MQTITYIGAGTENAQTGGTSLSCPLPAFTILANDFLWLPCSATVSTVFGIGAASGWTRRYAQQSGGASPVGSGFYRVADGTESSNVTVTSPGGIAMGRIFQYRGVDPLNPFGDVDQFFGSSTGVTAYDIPAQTAPIVGCALLSHAWSSAASGSYNPDTTHNGGYTELWDSIGGAAAAGCQEFSHVVSWSGSGTTGIRNVVRVGSAKGGAAGVLLQPAPDPIVQVAFTKSITVG